MKQKMNEQVAVKENDIYWIESFYYEGVAMHCVLVAAIIVKGLKWKKQTITRSIFHQIESIFHQILGIPNH